MYTATGTVEHVVDNSIIYNVEDIAYASYIN